MKSKKIVQKNAKEKRKMCKIANCHTLYNDSAMIRKYVIYRKFCERKMHCTKANECIDIT